MKKLIPVYFYAAIAYGLLVSHHDLMVVRIIAGVCLFQCGRWAESVYPVWSKRKPGSEEK